MPGEGDKAGAQLPGAGEPFPQPGGGLGHRPAGAGFLFPAFDDRCANLYEALYYTKNTGESHQELVDTLFRQELPPPADVQKETFQSLLTETLGEDCSLDVVQSVQSRLVGMMAQHKEDKDPEPLVLSRRPGYGALHQRRGGGAPGGLFPTL